MVQLGLTVLFNLDIAQSSLQKTSVWSSCALLFNAHRTSFGLKYPNLHSKGHKILSILKSTGVSLPVGVCRLFDSLRVRCVIVVMVTTVRPINSVLFSLSPITRVKIQSK